MRYINMGFTGMFSVETVLKIIGFGIKVGILEQTQQKKTVLITTHHLQQLDQVVFLYLDESAISFESGTNFFTHLTSLS